MIRNIKKYGISDAKYVELIYKQKNSCAICGEKANGSTLHIDHSHSTGEVRGLLCHNCNVMLGHAKDNTQILLNAINYLNESGRES